MAYTKYESENVILPYTEFPNYQQIEKIEPVQKIQPYTPYRGWDDERRAIYNARKNKQVETFLANYNDPTELNSYIDALTNREAVSKKFGDAWGTISTASGTVAVLSFVGSIIAGLIPGGQPVAAALATTAKIAALPAIPAAADVTINKGIKPILAGKPKEAALNTLMNLGETMDYASNPIKGLFIEGPEGFIKGTGLAEGGRVNYDFDTGSFVTDMLLEVLSDPINWVQIGANAGLKTGTKAIGDKVAKQIMEPVTEAVNTTLAKTAGELSAEASEKITQKVAKTTAQVSQEWAEASYKKLTNEAKKRLIRDGKDRIQRTLVRALKEELPEANFSKIQLIINYSNEATSKAKTLTSALSKIENLTMDTLSSDIIKQTAGMLHYSEAFEKFMTKGALMSSGFGLGVEAAKNGWKGIRAWQNNFTINRLQKAGLFDKNTGINLAKWKDTKAVWEASDNYTTNIAGVISQRDKNAFYKMANEQFNRDLDLVKETVYGKGSPLEKAAALDARFTELYGYDFKTYVGYLKGINDSENDIFKNFVQYNTNAYNLLTLQSAAYQMGFKPKTGAQLLHVGNIESFADFVSSISESLSKTFKLNKDKLELSDKFYTVKINDARFNTFILNDPVIKSLFEDDGLYNLVKNIVNDPSAYLKTQSAEVFNTANKVLQSFDNFKNLKEFYDAVGQMVITGEKIKDIDAFKAAIIDVITGMRNNVSDALAGFDDITMSDVMHKLELMFWDPKTKTYLFNAAEHPEIKEQIAAVYKAYLEAQQRAGLEVTDAAILQNFTKSAMDLQELLPDFSFELAPLTVANAEIYELMNLRKGFDYSLGESFLTDRKTIFDIFKVNSERELSDIGLALKTVTTEEALNYFDLPTEVSGNLLNSVQQLGKSIQHNVEQLQQYSVSFTKETAEAIDSTYKKFRQTILLNPKLQPDFDIQSFILLKDTTNPYEQVAQLIEFNKMNKDKNLSKLFNTVLAEDSREVWNTVKHSEQYFVTDFAWDAQKQSAWIAEKQLNEDVINPMQMYDQLSLQARKIEHDFQEFRKTLGDGKLDRPKALKQERYINSLRKINNMLQYLEQTYASRFNRTIAEERIDQLRGILLQFSDLNEKYSNLVDTLEAYWNGTKTFQQSSKSMRGTPDFVDEFTPFWEQIKQMNADINATINRYNEELYENFKNSRVKFDKEYWSNTRVKFDKEHWKDIKVKWDKEEWDYLKFKFDKEEFKKRLYKFDKEELHLKSQKELSIADLKARFKHFDINDVPNAANLSGQDLLNAIDLYKQQIGEYNNYMYELYIKDKQNVNKEVFNKYIDEINEYNNEVYADYIAELKENNRIVFNAYTKDIKRQNDTLFDEYIAEIESQNNELYKQYISKLDAQNEELYQQYAAQRIDNLSVNPWEPFEDQQKLNRAINKATDINAKAGVYEFCNLTPEELKQELACRYRFVTFKDEDLEGGQLRYIFNKLKKNSEDVHFYYDEKTHRHWIYLDKKDIVNADGRQIYLNSNPVIRKQFKKRFDEFDMVDKVINDPNSPGIAKTLNELDDSLYELTGTHLGTSQGEYISDRTLRKIYEQMPEEVQKAIDIDEITDTQFFKAYRFNESVLGSMHSKAELGMYSGNMITNARNAMVQAGSYTKAETEYADAVFNSISSIDNPNGIFANYTNAEICEALQANPDYKLVTLADDKKYGVRVHEILPTSPEAIARAKELGAVIIPLQTFKDMYNKFNVRIGSTGAAKLWNRLMYMYKFGYLCRPGAWIRNFIDTNLKSTLEMGDEYKSYIAQSHKILDDVHRMNDFIQTQDKNGLIKSDAIKKWFDEGYNKYIDYDAFIELDRDFLSQPISGNITNMLDPGEAQDAWRTFTHMTGKIIDDANRTENYNRLAMYLYELDKGLDYTSALSKLAKTHFDYGFRTRAEQLTEMIFPFTTFSLKNYSYWIEQIEKHPWILKNYIHLMKPHWDFKDYTPQELARDKRVQTQILYGQLKLAEFNNKVLAFKANPSIQDAIQMFSDPINNVYEKLAAPIKMATGQEAPSIGSIPMVGPALQAIQTTAKTGSPVPSAIGVQPAPKRTGQVNFTNTNLSGTDKYTDNTYRTPKYRNNTRFDSYRTKGITSYRKNFYPVIDIAHELKMKYTTNVYAKIKNKVQVDVYKGIRYRIKLDANRFRT